MTIFNKEWKILVSVIAFLVAVQNAYGWNGHIYGNIDKITSHPRFKRGVSAIEAIFSAETNFGYQIPGQSVPSLCTSCEETVSLVMLAMQGSTDAEMTEILHGICLSYNIMPATVCEGLTRIFTPELMYIFRHSDVTATKFCGFALQRYNCPDGDAPSWNITEALSAKPPRRPIQAAKKGPRMKILHITDLHYQPDYQENGNAICGTYMCCREDQGPPGNSTGKAGKWGDYRDCDMPFRSLENMMMNIANQHKDVDLVFMTGDLPHHALWNTSRKGNLEIIENVTGLVKKYFPHTKVYPVVGNHEAHPVNCFPPMSVANVSLRPSYLYNKLAEVWSDWLPKDAIETVKQGGFYTVPVSNGLRVIVLNNNVHLTFNWWILYDRDSPRKQLEWLIKELQRAEDNGEKVYILGHVPPGTESGWKVWSREFRRIVNRFESTILAQFYGHLHTEELRIFYDIDDPKRPTSVAFVGGSATTYSYLNPNYKIFYADGNSQNATWQIVDHETWIYNLSLANQPNSQPHWFKLYSAKEDLRVDGFRPNDAVNMLNTLMKDKAILDKYHRYYVKDSDALLIKECDLQCKKSLLCKMVLSDVTSMIQCNNILTEIDRIDKDGGGKYLSDNAESELPHDWQSDSNIPDVESPSTGSAVGVSVSLSLFFVILSVVVV